MTGKICDICGRVIGEEYHGSFEIKFERDNGEIVRKDLCPSCGKAMAFLARKVDAEKWQKG